MSCVVCGLGNSDKHHIKTRGSGGTDDDFNILILCRRHHSEVHAIGAITFAEKYEKVIAYLDANGWQIEAINGHKKLLRKNGASSD